MKDLLEPSQLRNHIEQTFERFDKRFTTKQRHAIRDERDCGMCQFPECFRQPVCGANSREEATCEKHVHHILAHRYLVNQKIDPDFPENAITIGKQAHDLIHPDIATAKKRYHVDKEAFPKVFNARETELNNRRIYWVDHWDRPLQVIAIRQTQQARIKGWVFPDKDE